MLSNNKILKIKNLNEIIFKNNNKKFNINIQELEFQDIVLEILEMK
jgi:hypothetical protein